MMIWKRKNRKISAETKKEKSAKSKKLEMASTCVTSKD
jgi:hypothetical protein